MFLLAMQSQLQAQKSPQRLRKQELIEFLSVCIDSSACNCDYVLSENHTLPTQKSREETKK